MSNAIKFQQGTFNWTDLTTPDTQAALEFYGKLMGWTSHAIPTPEGVYTMVQKDGQSAGAIHKLGDDKVKMGIPPHWLLYVAVDELDSMIDKVKEAGGAVMAGPFDVMEAGRMAVCGDPTGAAFAMWQAKDHPGAGIQGQVGGTCWHELMTSDTAQAGAFYKQVFGWQGQEHNMGPVTYTMFTLGETQVGGMMAKPPQMTMPSSWVVYFQVADCDAAIKECKEMGGNACMEPIDMEGVGRFCTLIDPQGAAFAVLSK